MFTRLTYVCRTNRGLTSGYMWHICPVPGKSDTYIPLNRHERRPTTRARNRYKIRVPEILLAPQRGSITRSAENVYSACAGEERVAHLRMNMIDAHRSHGCALMAHQATYCL